MHKLIQLPEGTWVAPEYLETVLITGLEERLAAYRLLLFQHHLANRTGPCSIESAVQAGCSERELQPA